MAIQQETIRGARPRYALKRTLDIPFEEAERRAREELAKEGFGILTEIDVRETLKKKRMSGGSASGTRCPGPDRESHETNRKAKKESDNPVKLTAKTSARIGAGLAAGVLLGLGACSEAGTLGPGDRPEEAALLSVDPRGGSTGVDPNSPVTITFTHPMNPAMSRYAAVHEGDVTDSEVEGSWSWSEGDTKLTFTPAAPLEPATTYVVHLGGGMMDARGGPVDFGRHGPGMGGQWATRGMMEGGMMGDGPGSGPDHMGPGWRHPSNGTYGMVFTFRTAG